MELPTDIHLTSPFRILGLLGGIFHSYSNLKKKTLLFANSEEPDQTPRFAASDLVLHCFPMSYKKYARLMWVKKNPFIHVRNICSQGSYYKKRFLKCSKWGAVQNEVT